MFIKFEKIVEIAEWLPNVKIDWSRKHIESRCPYCGDSRTKKKVRRFYIDFYPTYDTFIFKCFRCGESGNIISLYTYLFNCSYEEARKRLTNKKYDPDYIKKFTNPSKKRNEEETIIDEDLDIDLKNECFSLNFTPTSLVEKSAIKKLKEFKEKRKIPDSLPIYIAHKGRYKGRIIIPIYVNNKLVYFQGRALYDDILPKYLNPHVEKNKIILNIDKFDPEKYIIITEGIIDAHSLENNQGTCVIGGYIDTNFINKVMEYTNKGIIICLDNPKKDQNSREVLKKLIDKNINKYKEKLYFFVMPDKYDAKDLNDLAKDYNMKNIYDFVVNNKHSILYMKMNLMK